MADKDSYSDDDFDSEEEEELKPSKLNSKPKKSSTVRSPKGKAAKNKPKRTQSRAGSPQKPRPSSASKTARELWSGAVKSQTPTMNGTGKGTKKSAVDLWSESLNKTGVGFMSATTGRDSVSGLKKAQLKNMSYSSTSHYLRQIVGTEKGRKTPDTTPRTTPGRPAYKSPEEYYDDILNLKKQIAQITQENSTMKSKVRRLEEDNLKKEREIEQLLDPSKSDELRRTLGDRKPDSGAVIHSLKQKILKLEHQLRDKEAAHNKLQSDLKTTKIEEMRMQMETFYQEIVRLNNVKGTDMDVKSNKKEVKENPAKLKALTEMISRMNEKNVRLQSENKSLKQDLEKVLHESAENRDKANEYEDMSKKQLLSAIGKLEKKLDRADADSTSLLSDIESRKSTVGGKIALEGSTVQKLDQLDRRETELLEENERQRNIIKRCKEDRAHYRKKCEEKDKDIKALKKEVEELHHELNDFYGRDKVKTPRSSRPVSASTTPTTRSAKSAASPRREGSLSSRGRSASVSSDSSSRKEEKERQRRVKSFTENRAAKQIQRGWRGHKTVKQREEERKLAEQRELALQRELAKQRERVLKADALREKHAARSIQRGWRKHHSEREEDRRRRVKHERQVQHFTENRAAKHIQRHWKQHRTKLTEEQVYDAEELIQSSIRGHLARKQQMKAYGSEGEDDEELTEIDDAIERLQSNMRGHLGRKEQIRKNRLEEDLMSSDGELEDAVVTVQSAMRGHISRKSGSLGSDSERPGSSRGGRTRKIASDEDSEDERPVRPSARSAGPLSSRSANSFRQSPASNRRGKIESEDEDDDDDDDDDDDSDDDDIVVTSNRRK